MTKTDVMIEVGKPSDFEGNYYRYRGMNNVWVYADRGKRLCKVKFFEGRVTADPIECTDNEPSRHIASESYRLNPPPKDPSLERENRMTRFCGKRPDPMQGCRIGNCINGGWEEVCDNQNPETIPE